MANNAGLADTVPSAPSRARGTGTGGIRQLYLGSYGYDLSQVARWTLALIAIGAVFVAIHCWKGFITAGLLWSLACTAIGWTVGFLFGIPRTVQAKSEVPQPTPGTTAPETLKMGTGKPATGSEGTDDKGPQQQVNTNLEQISDWLTKILVGLGLTQLNQMPQRLQLGASRVAEALGGAHQSAFALSLIIYFSVIGFLGGYLLTRLFLARAFLQAERQAEQENP